MSATCTMLGIYRIVLISNLHVRQMFGIWVALVALNISVAQISTNRHISIYRSEPNGLRSTGFGGVMSAVLIEHKGLSSHTLFPRRDLP